jgi:hypothetical protein
MEAVVDVDQPLAFAEAGDRLRADERAGRGGVEDDQVAGPLGQADRRLGGGLGGCGRENRGRQRQAAERTLEVDDPLTIGSDLQPVCIFLRIDAPARSASAGRAASAWPPTWPPARGMSATAIFARRIRSTSDYD